MDEYQERANIEAYAVAQLGADISNIVQALLAGQSAQIEIKPDRYLPFENMPATNTILITPETAKLYLALVNAGKIPPKWIGCLGEFNNVLTRIAKTN